MTRHLATTAGPQPLLWWRRLRPWLPTCGMALTLGLGGCAGEPPGDDAAAEAAAAQAPPGTDIWLATLTHDAGGALGIRDPMNVTRRPGYDNQPYFLPDGSAFFYTVIDDAGQADIWRYDVTEDTVTQVTRTAPESEYSPTPLEDGGFSVVRVEADSAQRLWRFDADGTHPSLLLDAIAPVGYHAWAGRDQVVLYVLGEPPTLETARLGQGATGTPATDIGRGMARIPGSNDVSFVARHPDGGTEIRRLRVATGATELLVEGVEGGDFHAWTPDGTLLQAHEARVYAWRPGAAGWREIADLTALGIRVTRMAVSPDGTRIALVGEALS